MCYEPSAVSTPCSFVSLTAVNKKPRLFGGGAYIYDNYSKLNASSMLCRDNNDCHNNNCSNAQYCMYPAFQHKEFVERI